MESCVARQLYIPSVLQKSGTSVGDLVTIYRVHIRSLFEFGSSVWGSSLRTAQKDELEHVVKRAIRCIAYPHTVADKIIHPPSKVFTF